MFSTLGLLCELTVERVPGTLKNVTIATVLMQSQKRPNCSRQALFMKMISSTNVLKWPYMTTNAAICSFTTRTITTKIAQSIDAFVVSLLSNVKLLPSPRTQGRFLRGLFTPSIAIQLKVTLILTQTIFWCIPIFFFLYKEPCSTMRAKN